MTTKKTPESSKAHTLDRIGMISLLVHVDEVRGGKEVSPTDALIFNIESPHVIICVAGVADI